MFSQLLTCPLLTKCQFFKGQDTIRKTITPHAKA